MKKLLLCIFIAFILNLFSEIQFGLPDNNDGPYVFLNDETNFFWINDGNLCHKTFQSEQIITIPQFEWKFYIFPDEHVSTNYSFLDVDSLFAVSDIHGQYDTFVNLLQSHHIVNTQNNWNFGNGHLLIVGDVFDRGSKVTECLWFIHQLQKQASEYGGYVHFLLGNHEIMILQNDLRYVHEKYTNVACPILKKTYSELFGDFSFLGDWIKSCNTVIQINDFLFVHAGISPKIVEEKLTIDKINTTVRKNLKNKEDSFLFHSSGPFWYRGYFHESEKYDKLTENEFHSILENLNVKKMIVGHTTQDSVITLFNDRLIAIDSGLKRGNQGEGLFWKDNQFFRALLDGKKKMLQ